MNVSSFWPEQKSSEMIQWKMTHKHIAATVQHAYQAVEYTKENRNVNFL